LREKVIYFIYLFLKENNLPSPNSTGAKIMYLIARVIL